MLLTLKHQVLLGLFKKLSAAHRDVTFLLLWLLMHWLERLCQVVVHLLFNMVLGAWLLLTGFVEVGEAGNVLGHGTGGTLPSNILLLCSFSCELWIQANGVRACRTLMQEPALEAAPIVREVL